jgi:hypothetical protein
LNGIPPSGRLAFRALRNGAPLGTHDLVFTREGDVLTVDIAVDYVVKIGPLPVFRYKMRCRESWRDGLLISATADTDHNGKPGWMRAQRSGAALLVNGSKSGKYPAPAGALLASHWNQAQLEGPMINPQDGELLNFTVTPRGQVQVPDPAGVLRPLRHFSLAGRESLDLWYDADGRWVSLRAQVADGSTVTYLPTK